VLLAVVALPPAWSLLRTALQPAVVAYMATHLTETEKQEIRQQLQGDANGMFSEIPDPVAARVGKAGFHDKYKGVLVDINAAGMRGASDFVAKSPNTFRIICLGDSYVFGTGVETTERFCDRLQDFYQKNNITADGKKIETVAVGLPSYTTQQEAAYLSARLDDYAPDIILVVSVQNDITDNAGVTTAGSLTSEYSIEQRAAGSAVFSNQAGIPFGEGYYTALTTDLSPLARQQWDKAFAALQHLDQLQKARGGNMLLSVLEMPARHSRYFYEIYKQRAHNAAMHYLLVDYWQGKKTRLPDDGHPNAYGHELIAAQYVHTLSELGWVPVPENTLPVPDVFEKDPLDPPPDAALLAQEKALFVQEHLSAQLDFSAMRADDYGAVLGGLFPENSGEKTVPWASVRAAFLLRIPEAARGQLRLQLALPERSEAFPFELSVSVNGVQLAKQSWPFTERGNTVTWVVPVAASGNIDNHDRVVEVLLETPRYFSGLQDHRMKSYRLLSAAIE
jgi:lysophospholipase L1-like esterase